MSAALALRLSGLSARDEAVGAAWPDTMGRGTQSFPGESVILLSVRLPSMSAAQRRSALPFAVEDRIAQPLEDVQVVAGPRQADGSWLVAVVARRDLDAHAAPPGAGPAPRLVPDILRVPAPATGWAVVEVAGRVLVRAADGTGFACAAADLALLWQAADQPVLILHAGTLPEGVKVQDHSPLPPPDPALARFDLRAGHHTARAQMLPRGVGRVAVLLALAAVGHLAVVVSDVAALDRLVDRREAALRVQLAATGTVAEGDIDAALATALAARQPAAQDGFLPVLARVAAALAPHSGTVTLRDLRYAAAPPSFTATFEASDLGTLQSAEAGLRAAGLAVRAGAATSADGVAEVNMSVTGGGT